MITSTHTIPKKEPAFTIEDVQKAYVSITPPQNVVVLGSKKHIRQLRQHFKSPPGAPTLDRWAAAGVKFFVWPRLKKLWIISEEKFKRYFTWQS